MADLSLILFMVMAGAASQPTRQSPAPAPPPVLPALGDPVAIWSAAPGGPSLAKWLAEQPGDPRQRLTIVAAPEAAVIAQDHARAAGRPARVVLEPGLASPPYAALTYDRPAQLAQGLLHPPQ